jgi:response regulator NasT
MDVEMAVVDVDVPAEDAGNERQARGMVYELEEGVVEAREGEPVQRPAPSGFLLPDLVHGGLEPPQVPAAQRSRHDREALPLELVAHVAYTRKAPRKVPDVRILVAEDETIIRLDLRELLEHAGFDVCAEAKDGEEAVELARTAQPDLAVLDVKMPKLDGIEAARRILEERPIPIVMLTAYGQEELVSRAVEAGVFGYLVKPFREQDLLPAIAAARARHDELQAVRAEAESLADALAARKMIERAKGLLMEKEKLSEQEAFARLRKASQASGRPLKVIAEAVVETLSGEA